MLKSLRFRQLCERQRDGALRYATMIVHNSADAEDVVQEAFLRLWNNLDTIAYGKAPSWLLRTIRNLCLDLIRRRGTAVGGAYPIDGIQLAGHEESPDDATERSLLRERLTEALAGLPEKQRSVFTLRDINGHSYREVADALGITMEQTKVTLYRARLALRKQLAEKPRKEIAHAACN